MATTPRAPSVTSLALSAFLVVQFKERQQSAIFHGAVSRMGAEAPKILSLLPAFLQSSMVEVWPAHGHGGTWGTSYIVFVKRKSKSLKNIFQNNFLQKGPFIQQHLSIKSSQDFTLVRRISRQ
jgi:hypothetical protein